MRHLRISKNFVGLLVAAAFVATAVGCSGQRAEQARQMGDVHLQNRNFAAAKENYERALERNPANARAQLGLAQVLRAEEDMAGALTAYEKTVELDPSLHQAYIDAAQILLAEDEFDAAADWARRLADADRERGTILRATVERRSGSPGEAIRLLEQAKGELPDSVPLRIELAQAYAASDQLARAEEELRAVVDEIDPTSLAARMALMDVYRAQGKLAEIEDALRASIAQQEGDAAGDPNPNVEALVRGLQLQLALTLLATGKQEEAISIAEEVITATPDAPWANYVYGSVLLAEGRTSEAVEALQAAATALPNEPEIARRLAMARAGGGVEDDPKDERVEGEGSDVPPPATEVAAGWQELWRTASLQTLLARRDQFEDVDDPNFPEILALAAMFTGNGPVLSELMAKAPQESPVRKVFEHLSDRDFEGARNVLDEWRESEDQRAIMRANAAGFVDAMVGLRSRALQTLIQAAESHPENAVAFYNIASLYNSAGMPEFAAQALEKLLERAPESLETRVLLYRTLRRAEDIEGARASAEATYGLFPDERDAIVNLSNVYLETGEVELALSVLRRGVESRPDDTDIRGSLALGLLRTGEVQEAQQIFESTQFDGGRQREARELLALTYAMQGNWQTALGAVNGLDDDAMSSVGALVQTAALLKTDGVESARDRLARAAESDSEFRRRAYLLLNALGAVSDEKLGQAASFVEAIQDDTDAAARYALALAAMQARAYRGAYTELIALEDRAGQHPPIATLLFSALSTPTAVDDPIAKAEAVAERYSGAYVQLGIAAVYDRFGEEANQRDALRKGVELEPESPETWLALAYDATKDRDESTAMDALQKVIDLGAATGPVYNNYAHFLLESGEDSGKALDFARKAAGELKNNPSAAHTLGRALVETGNYDEAAEHLGLALQLRPGAPEILYDMGRVLIETGRAGEGRRLISQAVRNAEALDLEFTRRDEARGILGSGEPMGRE